MTPLDALAKLDSILAQIQAPRAGHVEIQNCVAMIQDALATNPDVTVIPPPAPTTEPDPPPDPAR